MTYRFTRDMPPLWKVGDILNRAAFVEPNDFLIATWLALGYIEKVEEEKKDVCIKIYHSDCDIKRDAPGIDYTYHYVTEAMRDKIKSLLKVE